MTTKTPTPSEAASSGRRNTPTFWGRCGAGRRGRRSDRLELNGTDRFEYTVFSDRLHETRGTSKSPDSLERFSVDFLRLGSCLPFFVGEHDSPQVCGEVSFECACRGPGCFSFCDFLVVERSSGARRHPDLDHGDHVDGGVQLPVAESR